MLHTPGKRWRHIILNAHGTWLSGDPRGFRNRQHRLHSSGDYRSPPPPGEHRRLHSYNHAVAAPLARLPRDCLVIVSEAVCQNLSERGHSTAVIAVTPVHAHVLAELLDHVATIKTAIGWCKRFATRAVREIHPELKDVDLWAAGEAYKAVDDAGHFGRALVYIATKQGADAWVWRDLRFDHVG